MRGLELTRRGVLGTAAVLAVVAVCVRLGVWQLDRRAERESRNRAVAERMALPPIALDAIPADTAGLVYRRARVSGPVDDDRAIVLAGRSLNGSPGVHLLAPVRIGGGAVLVNRGWLPAPDAATVDLDAVRVDGELRAEGVLVPFPDAALPAPDGFQVRWFRVDGGAIRGQYPYPVAPLYLVATDDDAPPDGPVPLGPPTLDPGPHLSYAIQWFSFAGIFLVGWIILVARRPRDGAGDDAGDDAG